MVRVYIKIENEKQSLRFVSRYCEIVINLQTRKVVSVNRTHTKTVEKKMRK